MEILTYLRDRLSGLTIEQSVVLLRNFGHYDSDKITVLTHRGYRNMFVWEVVEHFNGSVPVTKLKPVYFWGGPMVSRQYKGDYLTYIVDRAMYVMCEKGWNYVNATINYCEGLYAGCN
jgi:hypothetical protein